MTVPTITALPTAPNRATDDAATFAANADAFVAALPDFGTEVNAVGTAINALDVTAIEEAYNLFAVADASGNTGTSTTSVAVGTGAKSFTTQTGKLFYTGQTLMIASSGTPTAYMVGTVTSYNTATGALVMKITVTGGSGTKTDWNIYATSPVASGSWTQIATATPTGTGTVTFSNIPSTYTDLYLVADGVSSTAASDFFVVFASDDNGSTWTPNGLGGSDDMLTAATLSYYGLIIAGYNFPTGICWGSHVTALPDPGAGLASDDIRVWRAADGINALMVVLGTGNYDAGGTFTLYGR